MPSIQTGPSTSGLGLRLQLLAIPAVTLLVLFLGYGSQYLFHSAADLAPGPPSRFETVVFNVLLACLWWAYYKACSVDPGRFLFPEDTTKPKTDDDDAAAAPSDKTGTTPSRWCKKCARPKPPRAHHCRHCGRCIPRMDHHCPWTTNCVSLQTFPHFLRFLAYTNASLAFLGYLLVQRFAALWASRHLPAYLGPTLPQLVHLTLLGLVGSAAALALAIMLATSVRGWALNTTMIEGWEVERHEALVERGSDSFWSEDASPSAGGGSGSIQPVEFPYDLGFFRNMAQAMGTANVLAWFWPWAGGPRVAAGGRGTGWEWEENGFNAREGMWPPPDPEKLRRARSGWPGATARSGGGPGERTWGTPDDERAAFRARQAEDLRRWENQGSGIVGELDQEADDAVWENQDYDYFEKGMDGEPGWTNSDGDRLRDYGVDEDTEADGLPDLQSLDQEDEDVPLGELLRRRKAARMGGADGT